MEVALYNLYYLQAGIDRANLYAGSASLFITVWEVLPHGFCLSSGEVGQTGKVNRAFVVDKYKMVISQMFAGDSSRR